MNPGTFALVAVSGLAAVFGLIAMTSKEGRPSEDALAKLEELRAAVLKNFDVKPGCAMITYIGDPGEAAEFWAGPANEYIAVAIELAQKANLTDASAITEYVARDLFPGCEWPPEPGPLTRVDKKTVWYGLRAAVEKRMGGGA